MLKSACPSFNTVTGMIEVTLEKSLISTQAHIVLCADEIAYHYRLLSSWHFLSWDTLMPRRIWPGQGASREGDDSRNIVPGILS
jgi:hypothetical protein